MSAALSAFEHVAFDSAPLIYFIEKNLTYLPLMKAIFRQLDKGDFLGHTSALTLTELLSMPKKHRLRQVENEYYDLLLFSRNFRTHAITIDTALQAADLRARYNLRTPDAIHVASALTAGCDALLTNDRQLKRIEEITILVLDDLIAQPGTEPTNA